MKPEYDMDLNIKKTGYYSSIFLSIITLVTFGFAITAVPISGAFCLKDCIEYPYLDTLSQYPKDYLWMFLAILLVLSYLIYMVSVHSFADKNKKIFSRIAFSFALGSSVILLSCYFVQFTVIPASLINGETDGIALITQYNPHGIFIALEELGYLMMSFSFLFIAPVFKEKNRIQIIIKWVFIVAFILAIIAFALINIKYGLKRDYRFELAVISINWIVLVVNGILTGIVFKRAIRQKEI